MILTRSGYAEDERPHCHYNCWAVEGRNVHQLSNPEIPEIPSLSPVAARVHHTTLTPSNEEIQREQEMKQVKCTSG